MPDLNSVFSSTTVTPPPVSIDPAGNRPSFIDFGPLDSSTGCGIKEFPWPPDSYFYGAVNLTPACDNHDSCSDPVFQRSNKSLGDVLDCQGNFFRDVYEAGGDSFFGRVGSTLLSAVYGTAVSTVALGQWGVNRILDGWDAAVNFVSKIFS